MAGLQPGDSFPEGVVFDWIKPSPEKQDVLACGLPTKYNASEEFKTKKAVLVAVPGAFTPTCQEKHVVSYIADLGKIKAKGVEEVVIVASNDAFVMSAWGKANGVLDDSILFVSDTDAAFAKSIGWNRGERSARYAIIVDHGKVLYAKTDSTPGSIANSGAGAVLAHL